MRIFRVALTGDYLNAAGESAYGDLGWDELDRRAHIECHFLRDQAPRGDDPGYWQRLYSLHVTPGELRGVAGLVVLRPYVGREALAAAADELVVIGRSGAGYDKIEVAACTEFDVALFNAPLALNHATASSALLFMLALAKRLDAQQRLVRAGRWDLQASTMGSEIQGRTLGIVGLGHSGRELARLAQPFAMRVLGYSRHATPAQAAELGIELVSLERLMSKADFVSLHARLEAETRQMIGAAELALMKPTAFLINIARGELIDQQALVRALAGQAIGGAALDVFEHEPLPADDPLLRLDNVILTPHWLCSTTDAWRASGRAMVEGMLRAATGLVPEHVVNREVLDRPGFCAKLARYAENRSG